MSLVYHHNNKAMCVVYSQKVRSVVIDKTLIIDVIFHLSEKYSNRFIILCDEIFSKYLIIKCLYSIFYRKLIMSFYNIDKEIFDDKMGYVEHSVFVNVKKNVPYNTWMMFIDIVGIHSEVLQQYKCSQKKTGLFKLFLNYVIIKFLRSFSNDLA